MDKTRPNLTGSTGERPSRSVREVRSLGGYRLLRRLGEGGMGSVYLGFKEGADQPVAIKVLSDQLTASPDFVDRFYREARNGACLDHPNIVHSYLVAQDPASGRHFLVLEYVEGSNAQDLLDKHGPLVVGDAVSIVLGIARALEHAHSRHIIHRDIKPDNILLTRTGLAKLADLGLAKKLDEVSRLTATRQGFGTTPYMPYEQALNARSADERSDIYALGATFYHLLTGVVPFQGKHDLDVIEKKKDGDYPAARTHRPSLPEEIDWVLDRMLARDPEDRYPNATELIQDLETLGLATDRPSFAEAAKATADPTEQTCVSTAAVPTRFDIQVPAQATPPPLPAVGTWYLRYRNRAGRVCNARATTDQVLQRVQAGQLPASVEARRHHQDAFQPLTCFPEFRALMTGEKIVPAAPPGNGRSGSSSGWMLLAAAGSMLLGVLAGLLALGCLHR